MVVALLSMLTASAAARPGGWQCASAPAAVMAAAHERETRQLRDDAIARPRSSTQAETAQG
jgi:hypothetical protein